MTNIKLFLILLCFAGFCLQTVFAEDAEVSSFESSLEQLTASRLKARSAAIDALTKFDDDSRLIDVIAALLTNSLYYRKSDKSVAVISKRGEDRYATGILNGENFGKIASGEWKKIIINNRIRTYLRGVKARIELNHPSPEIRKKSVEQVLTQIDLKQEEALKSRLEKEPDENVKQMLELTLAVFSLKEGKGDTLRLISEVKKSAHPSVRKVLSELAGADSPFRPASRKALKEIQDRVSLYGNIETLFFGLSLGSVLVLAAIGLAITFGVMGVINMAHGELIMLGAYTTYVVQLLLPGFIEYSVIIAIPLAFLVSGTVGIFIERGIIRSLYGRPLETLLATFGVSLVLQQIVRSIFSPLNRAVETPSWMSGVWQVNEVLALTWNRLFIILFVFIVFAGLFFLLKKTSLGLKVRAVSQNRSMARAMGVRAGWVDAMTFGLGSGIAGVAGVALSQLTNVGPNLGQAYIIDSFMVVVFGGVGNLWGTLFAGLGLGIGNKILEPFSGAVLAKILILVFIILFIQKRPRGLFPQKGRSAGN